MFENGSWMIFPQQALDNSIITAVLIGLVTLLIFTEVFGWVFVGYVVPGYLASVFLTLPESGFAIIFEAIITYALVWLISERGAKARVWARFFGRERFLLFVYVSVVVRLVMESAVLPRLSLLIPALTGIELQNDFFSVGLVLVPLLANAFWKTGMARGLLQSGTATIITYAALALVLVPFTNMNLGKFELTYENVALDFFSSPKLYIILLTGATLASSYNLRYGWDYNGIMMPALIAIAFFSPWKILTTFVEAMLVAALFFALTKLPGLRSLNFGGGRKITAVFFTGYVVKWIIAVVLPDMPTLSATDLFGFGYLLPSLLGVKILQKRQPFVVLLPTFNAAFYAVVLGSAMAFGLHAIDRLTQPAGALAEGDAGPFEPAPGLFFEDLLEAKVYTLFGAAVEHTAPNRYDSSTCADSMLTALDTATAQGTCKAALARATLSRGCELACRLREDPELGPYLVLHDAAASATDRRGHGALLVRPKAKGPVLEIPRPISEPLVLEAAFILVRLTDARAVLLPGYDEPSSAAKWGDALRGEPTVFQLVHEGIDDRDLIQVRCAPSSRSGWHVKQAFPYSVALNELRGALGDIELRWSKPPERNALWRTAASASFGALWLDEQTVYRASPRERFGGTVGRLELPVSVTGLIERWVVEQKDFIHPVGSGGYTPPTWQEIELFENEIFRRILALLATKPDAAFARRLGTVQIIARFLGYQVIWFTDLGAEQSYIILKEREGVDHRHTRFLGWGTAVFRMGTARPWAWFVPRPLYENGTLGIAARRFDRHRSRALYIPGASYRADPLGRNDILSMSAPRTLAHAMLAALLRAEGSEDDILTIAVRGAGDERLDAPFMLSTGDELVDKDQLEPPARRLFDELAKDGEVTLFKGGLRQLGLQGLGNPLAGLVRLRYPGRYTTLWVSQARRQSIYEGEKLENLLAVLDANKIPYELGESGALASWFDPRKGPQASSRLPDAQLAELVADFAAHKNLAAYERLLSHGPAAATIAVDLRETRVHVMAQNAKVRCIATLGFGPMMLEGKTGAAVAPGLGGHCLLRKRQDERAVH